MSNKTNIRVVYVVISKKARGFVRETRTRGCLFRRLVYDQALCRPSSDRVASAASNRYFSHKRQLNQCLQSYSAGNQAALCSLARLDGRTRSNIGVSAIIPLSMTCRCPHSLSSADPGSPSDLLHRLLGRFTGRRAEPSPYNKDGRCAPKREHTDIFL
ncbi:hypothetical protein QQF64_006017 [Cirrhinus molitorella]|uniref:Uncharacterized protein n=1 Tax=Cirrhinus molitorella TaxID=172907 RepID=A0ABR3MDX0_9TELE